MRKKKITTCMILLLMAAALTGLMLYTAYVKEQQQDKRGTLVSAGSEMEGWHSYDE